MITNSLKRRVMARIYLEYTKNLITEYPDYVMFLLFMVASFAFVSVRNVLANLPKDSLASTFIFFVSALKNTTWVIQVLIIGFLTRVAAASSVSAYRRFKIFDLERWIARFRVGSGASNT